MTAVYGMEIHGDPGAHALSVNYFADLKSSPFAHQLCMDLLTVNGPPYDDRCKKICLTILRNYLRDKYDVTSSTETYAHVKDFVVNYVQLQLTVYNLTRQEDEKVRRLVTEVYTLVCFTDYPQRWANFVRFMADSVHAGSKVAQHYLDVMNMVSDSIAEPRRLLPDKTPFEIESIVHYIEERDIDVILNSFCFIFEEYEHTLAKKCLETVASFVQWVDVSHVMKHDILKKIAFEMNIPEKRDLAAMCYIRMISNFKTEHKWRQSFLNVVFSDLFVLHKDRLSVDYNTSFAVRISHLLNVIGLKLLECHQDAMTDLQLVKAKDLRSSLCSKFSQVVTFIKDINHEVSKGVVPFAKGYMKLLSERQTVRPMEMDHVQSLLRAVLVRIRMDRSYKLCEDIDNVHEEDEFCKYRKTMCEVVEQIFLVDRKVVFDETRRIILGSLVSKDWEQIPFYEAEYPVYVLGLVGRLFLDCDPPPLEYAEICDMFRSLVNCGVVYHPHIVVPIQYFATLTSRVNLRFFESRPKMIQPTLNELLGQGLSHSNYTVRSRCAECLSDFVRHFTPELKSVHTDLIPFLMHFLDAEKTSRSHTADMISGTAQLRLTEAVALIVTSSDLDKKERRDVISNLVQSASTVMADSFVSWLRHPRSPRLHDHVAVGICHGLSAVTMVAKAFENPKELAAINCEDVFLNVLQTLQGCAVQPMYRTDVHEAMLNLMKRMLICLDEKIVPFFSTIVAGHLLRCYDPKSVIETSDLLIEFIYQLKHKISAPLRKNFGKLICHVYDNLTTSSEDALTEEKRIDILENRQISLLSILLALRDNDLLYDIVNDLEIYYLLKVFYMISLEALEGQVRKYRCNGFNLLMHLVKSWDTTKSKLPKDNAERVFSFVIKTAFRALKEGHEDKDNLDDEDEYDNLFFHCACLLKAVYEVRGKAMTQWLSTVYLPRFNVSVTKMAELVQSLKVCPEICTNKLKEFFAQTQLITLCTMPSFADMFKLA